MTVNTLVKEKEMSDLYSYLKPYYEAGLDAVLVQDMGALTYIRKHFPDLPVHISTQMTVTGKYSARDLKALGAVRVVPARELSLKEIREIYDDTGLEVETFVHGALCYCYSGQCLFSSLIGGRSGNRGRCAQTCRLPFDAEQNGKYVNKKNEKYILSLKDLCTLDLIPDILEAGVCSLKIEGRMKTALYVADVARTYRQAIDDYFTSPELYESRKDYYMDEISKCTYRQYTTGFFYGPTTHESQIYDNNTYVKRYTYLGIVNDIDEEELKKPSVHVDMPVHADAADLLSVLDQCLDQVLEAEKDTLPDSLSEPGKKQVFTYGEGLKGMTWNETCAMWKKKYPVVQKKHWEQGEEKAANVYAAVQAISSRLKEGQITVVGNGSACVVGGHAQIIKKGQRFISNSGIASMGYGLPASIGACVADHSQDIILITGDGSIQMNLQELETVVSHRMPIKIFIINNGGYHSIRQTQKNFFGEPLIGIGVDSGDLGFPSMEKLAWAYGFPYVSIHGNKELGEKVEETLAMDGPVICEVFVTLDQNFEPKSAAKRLPDGTLVSPPLEDLSPFLPDEEMDRIMLIPRIKK